MTGALLGCWLVAPRGPDPALPPGFDRHPRLEAAARVLAATPRGRAVLARYSATSYRVVVADPYARAANRWSEYARATGRAPDFLTDHRLRQILLYNDSLAPAAIAVGLAHEMVHVLGRARAGTRGRGEEELAAWNAALDLYLTLPDSVRTEAAPKYGPYAQWRARAPAEYAATMRCVYPNTPGCPSPRRPAQGQ